MRWLPLVLSVVACGGGDDSDPEEPEPPPPVACEAGDVTLEDGSCLVPGMQLDGCPAGERLLGGACVPAGIPPDGCADGFEHDGDVGCLAILPDAPCGPGSMAIPGETACRPVGECAAGPWGDIPVDASTEHVDGSYAGGDSDGSQDKPWTTVSDAVSAAANGAVIAIAAGSYPEDVRVQTKSVRIWGVCAEMVEIVGQGVDFAAIDIRTGASGTEVHQIALTGAKQGIALDGSESVLADRVWIHDTGGPSIVSQVVLGPSSIEVVDSLLEGGVDAGAILIGAAMTMHRSVVRDVSAGAGPAYGEGIGVRGTAVPGKVGTLLLTSSVIERNQMAGVAAIGGQAVIEASVLRGNTSTSDPQFPGFGAGAYALVNWVTGERAGLTVRTSRIEANTRFGIGAQASDLEVDRSVIADTLPFQPDNRSGKGIDLEYDETTAMSADALIGDSVIERNQEVALHLVGSNAQVVATVVRDTLPQAASQNFGRGISAAGTAATPAMLTLQASRIDANTGLGVHINRSLLTMEGTLVKATRPHAHTSLAGRGVNVQADFDDFGALISSGATISSSHVEANEEVGIFVLDSTASIASTLVRATTVQQETGNFGDGIAVVSSSSTASADVASSTIDGNERAGLLAFDASVAIANVRLSCQPIHLNVEGMGTVADGGANHCLCGDEVGLCQVQSSGLTPPAAIE